MNRILSTAAGEVLSESEKICKEFHSLPALLEYLSLSGAIMFQLQNRYLLTYFIVSRRKFHPQPPPDHINFEDFKLSMKLTFNVFRFRRQRTLLHDN